MWDPSLVLWFTRRKTLQGRSRIRSSARQGKRDERWLLVRPEGDAGPDVERVAGNCRAGVDSRRQPGPPEQRARARIEAVDRAVGARGEDDIVRDRGAAERGRSEPVLPRDPPGRGSERNEPPTRRVVRAHD